jgi:hypothetical protein
MGIKQRYALGVSAYARGVGRSKAPHQLREVGITWFSPSHPPITRRSPDMGDDLSLLSRLMRKLGISDLPSLVKFAIQHGLTPLE